MRLLVGAVASCLVISSIGRNDVLAKASVTFNRDIAPLLFEHCSSCHRPGQIAPFSLLTYEDARPRARELLRAVRAREMPPWKPRPGELEFIGARRLTDAQIALVQRWVDDGAARGRESDLPPPPPASADGWSLGEPDLIVALEPYVLPATGPDVLRNFAVRLPIDRARYVDAIQFHPGNARVVHHANIRLDRTSLSRRLDEEDPAPGFDGRIATGLFPDGQFLGWTPGQSPVPAAHRIAWRLEPGDLVVQLHLHPSGEAETVSPRIGLYFTERIPSRIPVMLRLGRQDIEIAPGVASYVVEDDYTLPVDVTLHGVQPHAHYRARRLEAVAALPNGTRRALLTIDDWDFNWQDSYRYLEPVALPKGTRLLMRFTFDNSQANRRNPDWPPRRVHWGQNSSDEMGDVWFQVTTRTDSERDHLLADFGPKVTAEDARGFEKRLASDPDNLQLHQAAAAAYLLLDRTPEARGHLRDALRLDPHSAEAHYNLALALVREQRHEEAIVHLRRVVELEPDNVSPYVNLGVVLRAVGRFDEAIVVLTDALRLEPANAVAHVNIGGALAAVGREGDAIAHYHMALRARGDAVEALIGLSRLLSGASRRALRDPDMAVELARRAVSLTQRRDRGSLSALRAAYQAADRADDAARIAREIAALDVR